ncbi:MAG: CoA transferase [Enterocloster sp.]
MMLEGMKILSFVHGLYGGSASQILADLGAEVVRVEWDMTGRIRPGSVLDGENGLFFQMTGRNQKSISFNPQSPEGIDILHRLLQDYDIVLDNSPPGLLAGGASNMMNCSGLTNSLYGASVRRMAADAARVRMMNC